MHVSRVFLSILWGACFFHHLFSMMFDLSSPLFVWVVVGVVTVAIWFWFFRSNSGSSAAASPQLSEQELREIRLRSLQPHGAAVARNDEEKEKKSQPVLKSRNKESGDAIREKLLKSFEKYEEPKKQSKSTEKSEKQEPVDNSETIMHFAVGDIFRVCVNEKHKFAEDYIYLPLLHATMEERKWMGVGDLEALLDEVLQNEERNAPYLLDCFVRALDKKKKHPELAKRSCELIFLHTKDLITQKGALRELLESSMSLEAFLINFLSGVFNLLDRQTLEMTCSVMFEELKSSLLQMTLTDAIESKMNAVILLLECSEQVCEIWSRRKDVNVRGWNGRQMEDMSWLGCLFRMSPLNADPKISEEEASIVVHRHKEGWQKRVLGLLSVLLASKSAGKAVMEWFECVCIANKERHKMQFNPMQMSRPGLLMNCFFMTSLLRERMNSSSFSFRPVVCPSVLGWETCTPLKSNCEAEKESPWWGVDRYNTLLYIGLNMFHLWFAPLMLELEHVSHRLGQMRANPDQTEEQFQQARENVDKHYRMSYRQLTDNDTWNHIIPIYGIICSHWVKHGVPGNMPEFILSDLQDFFKYFVDKHTESIRCTTMKEMHSMVDIIILISGGQREDMLINNNYVRGSLCSSLHHLPLKYILENDLAHQVLAKNVIEVFCAVEKTDRHAQYHEKMQLREGMVKLMSKLDGVSWWQKQCKSLWPSEKALFVRFVFLLFSDMNYMFDEGLQSLVKIRAYELEHPNEVEPPADHQRLVGQAEYYLKVVSHWMDLFVKLVHFMPDPFLSDEVRDNIACAINNHIKLLIGPKCLLQVNDRARFKFEPLDLVIKLITVYVALGKHQSFLESLAKDDRSFKPSELLDFATKQGKVSEFFSLDMRHFVSVIRKAEAIKQKTEEDEVDVPEEFLCPLLGHLMTDPVKLPSGQIVDRSSIVRHLLTDETDPYTRVKLTKDMLETDEELKEKIENWKMSKKTNV